MNDFREITWDALVGRTGHRKRLLQLQRESGERAQSTQQSSTRAPAAAAAAAAAASRSAVATPEEQAGQERRDQWKGQGRGKQRAAAPISREMGWDKVWRERSGRQR